MDEKKKERWIVQMNSELSEIDMTKIHPEELDRIMEILSRMSDEEYTFFLNSVREKWNYYKRTQLTYESFLREAIYYARQGYLVNSDALTQEERERLSDLADTNGLFRGYIV